MIVYVCVTQWMFPLSINMHGFKWSCTNLSWCLVRQYVASNNTNVPCEALNGFRNGTYSVFWPNRMCKENTVVVILLRDIANGLWKTDSAYILQCIHRKQCWGDEFRVLHYIMCIYAITCTWRFDKPTLLQALHTRVSRCVWWWSLVVAQTQTLENNYTSTL